MDLPSLSTKRGTLADHAYEVLRDAIVTLRLKPGQQVFEAELGESLGVSRTPIREAFRRLLAEELIEVQPQRGALVAYMTKQKIAEARFVRICLEVNAFKEVAKKWDSADPRYHRLHDQVTALLQEQQSMVAEQDFDRFFQLDEQFHFAILEMTGNRTLISIIHQMRGHLNRMRYLELQETKHMRRLVEEHEAIFEAVVAGDSELTEILLDRHIRWLETNMPELIRKYPQFFM